MIQYLYGRKRFQHIFDRLLKIALKGQNFYNAGQLAFSGEKKVIKSLKEESLKLDFDSTIIFDVGATRGEYSEFIVKLFEEDNLHLHLFEPTSYYLPSLREKFGRISSIHINSLAIGNTNRELQFYCCTDRDGINSIYNRANDFQKNGFVYDHLETVTMETIDNYCSRKNVTYIHFLKVDTEGNELECLLGAKEMLEQNKIGSILFEFGGANVDARTYFYDFWNLLKEKYDIYRVTIDGIYPIKEYSRLLEIFLSVNYFAKLKPAYEFS